MDDAAAADQPSSSVLDTEILAFETATRDLVGLALRSVEDLDVSLPQFRLLLILEEIGPASSTACAAALGVVGSSITRLADRLHTSGHLVRGTAPDNRSVVTLALTDVGRETVRSVTTHRRRELSSALAALSPDVRAACAAALTQLHVPLTASAGDEQRRHLPM
ncbi:MarR family winged helix-turn-helix transcriptional regulator [Gordonia hydrophobica]|uniref:MarR family transcriptional regulator n=1 Tax=Gordonia hydrophobica TaxID=40516 RepID=A0ABZ2TXN9_9ACTN|nr:MarR family transcriptional regulator [Gordonia hydrophobica]MBM7366313.1 DNA-binding MarR family transcriptional regulator [Gordonia hydrophobica]